MIFLKIKTRPSDAVLALFEGYNVETKGDAKSVEISGTYERVLGRELDATPLNSNYENTRSDIFFNAAINYMKALCRCFR